jgi:hypothetical protein
VRRGAQFAPICIPTVCWKTSPPNCHNIANMLIILMISVSKNFLVESVFFGYMLFCSNSYNALSVTTHAPALLRFNSLSMHVTAPDILCQFWLIPVHAPVILCHKFFINGFCSVMLLNLFNMCLRFTVSCSSVS